MAEWCASNLRNCDGWKTAGLPLTTTSDENARLLDAAIRQLVSMTDCAAQDGFEKTCERLETSDPQGIMSRAFLIGLAALSGKEASRDSVFSRKMDKLEVDAEKFGNEREKAHVKAALLWGRGQHHKAGAAWDAILDDHPTDLIALRFAHDAHFFNGSAPLILGSIEKVIEKWRPDMPCYSFVHGMHAFGLEENGKYAAAEHAAQTALRLNRFDCWASHATAHAMEMTGRHREGKEFMYRTEDDWKKGWMLSTHNYWHTALFHIEHAEYESALSIFDREVGHRFNRTNMLLDMTDASSLLWRLELEGVDVGAHRWRRIKRLGEHIDNHSIVFNDVHIGLALYRQEDFEAEKTLRDSLHAYSRRTATRDEDNARISASIGLPLYDGMLEYARGEYDRAVETMFPIRERVVRIGGSHAQRDLFAQTLIQASILSTRPEHWRLAPQLLAERESVKVNSDLGRRMADKYRIVHSAA